MKKLATFIGVAALAVGCSKKTKTSGTESTADTSGSGTTAAAPASAESAPDSQVPAFKAKEMKDVELRKVAVAGSTAYAITEKDVYKSTDAGATFSKLTTVDGADFEAIYAASADEIFVSSDGDKELMYHSTDGGKTFKPAELETILPTHAFAGKSANDLYAVGAGGQVLHYDGHAWKDLRPDDTEDMTILESALVDGSDLWAVGDGCHVLHSAGGKITDTIVLPKCTSDLAGIVKVGGKILVGAANGNLLHYDGKVWTEDKVKLADSDEEATLADLTVTNGVVYGATDDGIARSTDGGATWTVDKIESVGDYLSIGASGKTIAAVGYEGAAHAAGWYAPEKAAAQPAAKPVAK